MRLFTKDIDKKLFNQYPKGADLEKQFVVGKIFNPYGRGRWYLINSDPNDPDYIWAIVQMGDIVEVGSVSRKELESIRVKPFGLSLERDLHFTGIKALDILNGLKQGKHYKAGGWVESGVNLTNELRGEDHDDYGTFELYKNGGEVDVKIINSDESYDKSRYEWLIGDYDKDGVNNVDDKKPFTQSNRQTIDSPSISNGINKLLSMKNAMDENMYAFVDELKNISPDKSKIYARTKTPYSILDKLIKKRLSTLTDLIGTTIVTQDKKELDEVKKKIESGKLGKVVELEDMYQSPKQGYRAYHFLIEKNGMPIELQLKTKRQKALNELSHEPYKLGKLDSDKLIKMTEVANSADNGDQAAIKQYNDFMQQPDLENSFYKYANGGMMARGGQLKMKHDKSHYQGMEVDGFKWQGFWGGYHHFVKKDGKGYLETRATDKDIEDGNLKDMIKYGVSKELGGYMEGGGKIFQLKKGDRYFSVGMDGGMKWNESPDLGYTYEREQAEALANRLRDNGDQVEIVKYNKDWWKMSQGGSVGKGNQEMLRSNVKAIGHHAKEIGSTGGKKEVEAWVVAKSERAATDLSDITHYLDGKEYADGGYMEGGGEITIKVGDRVKQRKKVGSGSSVIYGVDGIVYEVGERYDGITFKLKDKYGNKNDKIYSLSQFKKSDIKSMAKGGDIEGEGSPKYYIEFLNKEKGFKRDKKEFSSYEDAIAWGRKNLENFNSDMIRMEFADGGYMANGGQAGVDKHRIYFSSFAEVMDAIHDIAADNGYKVVEIFPDFSYGGVSYGQTKRAKAELEWDGNTKKGKSKNREKNSMNIQIYRMDSGSYELNTYFSYAEGGMMADGGEANTSLVIIDKLLSDRDKLESRLFDAKVKENERWNRLGWGSGMRLSKINVSYKRTDSIKEKMKAIDEKLKLMGYDKFPVGRYEKGGGVGEPYDTMTKYQIEKEYKKLNEKRELLKKKYGTFQSDEVIENEKQIDKIITLLYGKDFSGVGQKFKYANGGYTAKGAMTASQRLKARMAKK